MGLTDFGNYRWSSQRSTSLSSRSVCSVPVSILHIFSGRASTLSIGFERGLVEMGYLVGMVEIDISKGRICSDAGDEKKSEKKDRRKRYRIDG